MTHAQACPRCATPISPGARFCGACGAAIAADDDPAPSGRVIAGRYRLGRKLGQGGMGAVFQAEQISLERTVALKLLRAELSADPDLVRRFNAEAKLAAKLDHPNTVTLYDHGQDSDGTLFIAMEYIQGQSLRQAIAASGALPPARAVAIMEQVCGSLADAHAHGIVHRDMKPDNVMLSERGSKRDIVRVLDFGIAKLRDQRGDITAMPMTQAGSLVGTPQYMAPEQIRGETVDGRTDVYALGIVLYETVTGQLPFDTTSLMAMLSMHLLDAPVPPSRRRPGQVPPDLEALILAMLAKAPADRPPTMESVAQRLAALRDQLGAPPSAPGAGASSGPAPAMPAYTPAPTDSGHGYAQTGAAFTPAPVSTPTPGAPPPSIPMAAAAALAPAQAPSSMAHAPIQAPAATTAIAPPPRSRGRAPLWIALAIAVLAVGAIGGYLGLRASDDDDTRASDAPKTDDPARPVSTDFYIPPKRDIFNDDVDDTRE